MRAADQSTTGPNERCGSRVVPWPGLSRLSSPFSAKTSTRPRSTKTANSPLLGPAKNFVPRTPIWANAVKIVCSAGGRSSGRSKTIAPPNVSVPPRVVVKSSIVIRLRGPRLIRASVNSRREAKLASPVRTVSSRKSGASVKSGVSSCPRINVQLPLAARVMPTASSARAVSASTIVASEPRTERRDQSMEALRIFLRNRKRHEMRRCQLPMLAPSLLAHRATDLWMFDFSGNCPRGGCI